MARIYRYILGLKVLTCEWVVHLALGRPFSCLRVFELNARHVNAQQAFAPTAPMRKHAVLPCLRTRV